MTTDIETVHSSPTLVDILTELVTRLEDIESINDSDTDVERECSKACTEAYEAIVPLVLASELDYDSACNLLASFHYFDCQKLIPAGELISLLASINKNEGLFFEHEIPGRDASEPVTRSGETSLIPYLSANSDKLETRVMVPFTDRKNEGTLLASIRTNRTAKTHTLVGVTTLDSDSITATYK